jgi:tetratricopeptide (TPR) repeat protein
VKRIIGSLLVVAVLLGLAIASEVRLRSLPRADPLDKELLYLPTPEMLKLLSLGNEGLMADLVYIWSIQYYSQFQPQERFLYLEKVYDLITDLDPKYFDAYRIGALIMSIQQQGDPVARREAVERLYDKGLENLPESWELAEVAAWDFYQVFGDHERGLKYAGMAAGIPGAPNRFLRLYGRWQDQEQAWTVEDSIAYWEQALAAATDRRDEILCRSHLYDAYARLHRRQLGAMLELYQDATGECPSDWQPLIDVGWISEVPKDYVGNPYLIDAEDCSLGWRKRIRWK